MNKIKVLIIEGDEVQIKILEDYLSDNNVIIKYISADNYKKNLIKDLLHNLGVPSNINGYRFLVKAIDLLITNEVKNTSKLYKKIAEIYNTNPSNIESGIRYAIEVSWNRGNIDLINKIFGYSIDTCKVKPTNTEYLTSIKEIIVSNQYKIVSFDK